MLLPPFWRRRGPHVPAKNRIIRFRSVVKAAQAVSGYRERLVRAHLGTPETLNFIEDIEQALSKLAPIPYELYQSFFTGRVPAWRQCPESRETRSGVTLTYDLARAGVETCRITPSGYTDLYSARGMAGATEDLLRLGQALRSQQPAVEEGTDHAMVIFSGMDAGILTDEQRDRLWHKYQVPLFEQFVGTDGRVVASECEVHAGLHVRGDDAVVECVDGEIVLTSLTDHQTPALRVLSGLSGALEMEACDCGRTEPRIMRLARVHKPRAAAARA